VEEKERFKYYIAFIVLVSAGLQLAQYVSQSASFWNLISNAASVIIPIIGTILCYRANRSGDNRDFIGRMICLSWPIGIKVGVLFAATLVTVLIGTSIVFGSDADTDPVFAIFDALFEICYYWLLYKYVTIVAQPRGTENPDELGLELDC
jgi:hypothetical protein